ncbi:prepilin-type N-terminal cleavage/methylation domain-containing protein [Bdellovibrio sp. NC01]|uniref:prepilin-type N-terminal cleavage/methylation domain-containing protein n=1 Tax=Bdellovibrio sp. NC01 TaxID=2220073 RepID=UPI001158790B|nr:prepilin-type N-terminal cleavage/methylation domain-containing protein [Bdellovibrio sp. NC01]QDK38086.1 hypothetical protein DOE51_11055 [Bdellovibrio sp. NC01]
MIKKFNSTLKNNKGFTLPEVIVGVGLAAVVTAAVVATQVTATKDQMALKKQLDESIDEMQAERILFGDFNTVEPSYNNIVMNDDNGLNFFDYYPDLPANSVAGSLTRTITLSSETVNKTVSVVSQDLAAGATMNYDPTAAYVIGSAPADFNKAAPLTFVSVNRNNWVGAVRPGFWTTGMMLMFDTLAKVRPTKSDGTLDMQTPPRSPTFVGSVQGLVLQPVGEPFSSLLKKNQPDTGATIPDADTFLRNVPSVGGGQSVIRLRAVKVLQYTMEPVLSENPECYPNGDTTKKPYRHSNFYKLIYRGASAPAKVLLANKVCSFVMTRDSVLKRMIYFKINKPQDLATQTQTAGL